MIPRDGPLARTAGNLPSATHLTLLAWASVFESGSPSRMSSLVGQIIKGARASYRLLQPLKAGTVFKAQVFEPRDLDQQWHVPGSGDPENTELC
jgi:hypothetical protein